MDERLTAEILSHASNSGIVQMPGRKFPGIVIQGDSLSNLFEQVCCCLKLAKQHQDEDAYYKILMLAKMLQGHLVNYEKKLTELGIERPYCQSVWDRAIQDEFTDF
jgi:hypothetical protein